MRIYISGGINSNVQGTTPESRREAFNIMEARLLSAGHEVINPLNVAACSPIPAGACGKPVDDRETSHSWDCYLRYDLRAMMECDAVVGMKGWHLSKGAKLEIDVAIRCGFFIVYTETSSGALVMNQGPGHMRNALEGV